MADAELPAADQVHSPGEQQPAEEAVAIEGPAAGEVQEPAAKKAKHKHKHKHKTHKSKDKKKSKDKDAAVRGSPAADAVPDEAVPAEAAAAPQAAPDAVADTGAATAAQADAQPATKADSEPESGEIEGEVGGVETASKAAADAVADGVKSDKRRSSSDHKRQHKEKKHRHRSPDASRHDRGRGNDANGSAEAPEADAKPAPADADRSPTGTIAAAKPADGESDRRGGGDRDKASRRDGDAGATAAAAERSSRHDRERSERQRSGRDLAERERAEKDRSDRQRPDRDRSNRERPEKDRSERGRADETGRSAGRGRSERHSSRDIGDRRRSRERSRRRDSSRDRHRDASHGASRHRSRSRDRGLSAIDRLRRDAPRASSRDDSRDRRRDEPRGERREVIDRRSEREIAAERGRPLSREREARGRSRGRDSDHDRRRSRSWDRRDSKRPRESEPEPPPVDPEEQARLLAALEGKTEDEEDRLIEERRRRRQAILAKHAEAAAASAPTATALAAQQPQPQPQQEAAGAAAPADAAAAAAEVPAEPAPAEATDADNAAAEAAAAPEAEGADATVQLPASGAASPHSGAISPVAAAAAADAAAEREGSASPSLSTGSSAGRAPMDIWQPATADDATSRPASAAGQAADDAAGGPAGGAAGGGGSPAPMVVGTALSGPDGRGSTRGADVSEAEFASEAQKAQEQTQDGRAAGAEFDMFAEEAEPVAAPNNERNAATVAGLADSYDDAEGYYNLQVGEVVNDRYEVFATHGRGVFSSVLRARDRLRKTPDGGVAEVAIKIIRANETMHKAGQTERVILRKLAATDPEGKRHIIRLLSHFEFRGHLCLVFEPMAMNLRELTRKVARDVGINLPAVQLFGKQMLAALYHMHDCGVLHADIKPDNILVNTRHNAVKVCDFGSAMFAGDNSVTPYLVSRFYRPPEVILGLPYDYAMDMWSVGCVLYELFTGKILFPGRTNNEMLKLMMDTKGPFPKKMLRKGAFTAKHFDDDPAMSFKLYEEDPVSRKIVCRVISNPKVAADVTRRIAPCYGDKKHKEALADLLEKMLALDPDKRIKPKDALKHPFLKWGSTPKPPKPKGAPPKAKPGAAAAKP